MKLEGGKRADLLRLTRHIGRSIKSWISRPGRGVIVTRLSDQTADGRTFVVHFSPNVVASSRTPMSVTAETAITSMNY